MSTYTFGTNPYLDDAMLASFMGELDKIASDLGIEIPFLKSASNDPDGFIEMLKEAGIFGSIGARLGQYGQNIKAYANRARNALSGGDYARQMRELGSTSPMTSSAAKGTLQGTMGPMREVATAREHLRSPDFGEAYMAPASRIPLLPNGKPANLPRMVDTRRQVPAPTSNPLDPREFGLPAHEHRLTPGSLHPSEFGIVVPPNWGQRKPLPDPGLARHRNDLGPTNRPDIFAQAQQAYA